MKKRSGLSYWRIVILVAIVLPLAAGIGAAAKQEKEEAK
jgi:uncharacterized membrane protein